MKNTMRMIPKSSPFSRIVIKQGINPNHYTIPSFCLHTSNQPNTRPQNARYVFDNITNLAQALNLFDQMLQMRPMPPIYDYNKLLNILVKMKHYSHVIILFKQLLLLRFPVNDFFMSTVVNCYCHLKEVDLGFAIVAAFLKRGFAPGVVSVNCLLKGLFLEAKAVGDDCRRNKMVDDAMLLFEKMIQLGIPPDLVTYNTLIHGLCNFRRWEEADELLGQMLADSMIEPCIVTFNPLVNSYCQAGLIENAERVVQIMTERGTYPDVVTYTALMKGYCLQGQPDKAEEVLNLMEEKGLVPNLVSYFTVVNGYCKHKNIGGAWKVFKEMPNKGLKFDTNVYNCMIQGLFSVGRCSEALELFDEMKVGGLGCNVYTYGIVLDGLFNNGKIEEAVLFYHEVDSKGSAGHVSFYTTSIHNFCNNNQLDLACSIFNSLSSKGLYPDVIAYNAMIKGLCQEGMIDEVKELLDKMEKSGCSPDRVTFNAIIRGCLKHYDSFDSFNILKEIADKYFPLDASIFSVVLQQMQGSDEFLVKKSLIQKLISDDTKSSML